MPIFHSLPPVREAENRLFAAYRQGLMSHWGPGNRFLARLLGQLGLGSAWSKTERRLLPLAMQREGLSMASRRGVHRMINPAGYPASQNLLRNKRMFARHAAAQGLPTPETFDPRTGGLEDWLASQSAILAKPGYSSKGRGIIAYTRNGSTWRGPKGALGLPALIRQLEAVIARHGVIQELVRTDPLVSGISPGALPTVRVMTCLNEQGVPEACARVLRLGGGTGREVDNFNAGGLAVRIDGRDQCAAAFQARGGSTQSIADHPVTGEPIVGRSVAGIDDAIALGLRAHATLPPGFNVIGWDIGLSDRGPLVIEGNWNPGTQIIQLVYGTGIDAMRLGELYRFHLEQIPEERWREAKAIEW